MEGLACRSHSEKSLQRLHRCQQVAVDLHWNDQQLERRIYEHKNDLVAGFSKKYRCHRLVYYESFDDVLKAIDREKQLKRWNRTKKLWLFERENPTWEDLAAELFTKHPYQPDQQVPSLPS